MWHAAVSLKFLDLLCFRYAFCVEALWFRIVVATFSTFMITDARQILGDSVFWGIYWHSLFVPAHGSFATALLRSYLAGESHIALDLRWFREVP